MQTIKKHILNNGLTILVYPLTTIPKVAIQLWYGVGSKDENDGERGLAHLLEHMIFKGTSILSESDINLISHKLSGNCNAFTGHDYTCYVFDFPKQNWTAALPLLADCMRNCTFKEDLLNAELKAVIQELKMYKDDYTSSLCEELVSAIFAGHAYHYPIIGYKQDLWSITRQGLLSFYKKHYVPNNATLVIVGDVNTDEAIEYAKKAFENIPAAQDYIKMEHSYTGSFKTQQVVLHRDIQQPVLMFAWLIPGAKEAQGVVADLAGWVLGEGKGSRLYKKLVDAEQLAADLQVDIYELLYKSVLFLHIDPIDQKAITAIKKIVLEELQNLAENLITDQELQRAKKQAQMEHLGLFENNQKLAYEIGKYFQSLHDENSAFDYPRHIEAVTKEQIRDFFRDYMRANMMHTGTVLPLSPRDKKFWLELQKESDKEDEKILSRKVRESIVECGLFVEQITVNEAAIFSYPKATKTSLEHGLTLLSYSNAQTLKIDLVLDLKVRSFYDPQDKQGLLHMLGLMLLEGTQQFNDHELAAAAESRGISIDVRGGSISMSMLKDDLEFALSLLAQILTDSIFNPENIEKIRQQIQSDIAQFWDSPTDFAGQILKEKLYKGHPYQKNSLGTLDTIKNITRDDLLAAYKKYVSPHGARLAIVGDLQNMDVAKLVGNALKNWNGQEIEDIAFPPIKKVVAKTIDYPIDRDQTVLCFGGNSVNRFDEMFDALLLFEQVFSGGVLGSMSSQLFRLREQTGLFYTIGGSLVALADEQPGIIYIRTIVSTERLQEAEAAIEDVITKATDMISLEDLEHARNALVNTLVDNFESNDAMAQAFLFIDQFELPADYFDLRLKHLKAISLEDVKKAVREKLDVKHLIKVRIGRFG